ncbi:inorganic diphosphatase [Pedobacter sp. HMF7647]|uniref:inorganic diphosphatase n=1 Tax=Hufsiella arboris TaxID=2695275 RepID=A0A7K1YDG0_9SPHI|nr:inorganic diphosphatase [Hufsiella arboris]MXV52401.1 inorganic diphosphatase [Hufsiella arboris]
MKALTVIIETPKGSTQKFDYEPDLKCFKLKKILPAGLAFPFDFGFITNTKGEDGDPLDVIVISEIKTFTGCCMDCRIIGSIKALQTERDGQSMRNDRFLAIPEVSTLFVNVKDIDDLPHGIIDELERFFENYNEQAGKKFEVLERLSSEDAYKLINL